MEVRFKAGVQGKGRRIKGRESGTAKSFGELIAEARAQAKLTQREVAACILLEGGKPISMAYLNDLEHNLRTPARPHLIEQFAKVLDIAPELLYFAVRRLPPDVEELEDVPAERVIAAFEAFRRTLRGGTKDRSK